MTKTITKLATTEATRIEEIRQAYDQLQGAVRTSVDLALRIGKLLCKQRAETPHGEFVTWVEKNIPFGIRTAQRWMSLYRYRGEIDFSRTGNVSEAYRLLGPSEAAGWGNGAEGKNDNVTLLGSEIGVQAAEHTTSRLRVVNLLDIDPNPHYDLGDMCGTRITGWVNAYRVLCGADGVPWYVLAVRPANDGYQLICDHDRWAAMRLLDVERVMVSAVALTDAQMESALAFESRCADEPCEAVA